MGLCLRAKDMRPVMMLLFVVTSFHRCGRVGTKHNQDPKRDIWRLANHQCKWFLIHAFVLWRGTRKCAVFICCLYIYVYFHIYIICMYSSQIWEFPLNAWWVPQLVTIFLRRCPFRDYHLEIRRGHFPPWKGNPKTQLRVFEGVQHTSTISMC